MPPPRVRDRLPSGKPAGTPKSDRANWVTHPHHASSAMHRAVRGFNAQLEKLAELAIVLLVGVLLPAVAALPALWWFIPALFILVRPLAILLGMAGHRLTGDQVAIVAWFGIRGIGSIFYLMFALDHGVSAALAQDLVSLTLATVAISILIHGISALPLMTWYAARKGRCRKS